MLLLRNQKNVYGKIYICVIEKLQTVNILLKCQDKVIMWATVSALTCLACPVLLSYVIP